MNVIHVHQRVLKENRARHPRTRRAPLTYKKKSGGTAHSAFQVVGLDANGNEMFRVVYDPEHKLKCGAVCWVETRLKLVPLTRTGKRARGRILVEVKEACQQDCGQVT